MRKALPAATPEPGPTRDPLAEARDALDRAIAARACGDQPRLLGALATARLAILSETRSVTSSA